MTFPPPPPAVIAAPPRKVWRVVTVVGGLGVAAVAVGFVVFAPQITRIEGHSMSPGLLDQDRTVFVRPLTAVRRGEIVSYRYPVNPAKRFSGRIVGLPGERLGIVGGVVHIDGRPIDEPYLASGPRFSQDVAEVGLGADEYFILGDNRGNSSDSREWGPVPRRYILKRLAFIWYRAPRRF